MQTQKNLGKPMQHTKLESKGSEIERFKQELIEWAEGKKEWTISKTHECPKCGRFYGKNDVYCSNDRTKIIIKEMKYPETLQEPYNQAFDDLINHIKESK